MSDMAISGGRKAMWSVTGGIMGVVRVQSHAKHPGHTLGSPLVMASTRTCQFQIETGPSLPDNSIRIPALKQPPVARLPVRKPVTC